ncbi:MAG: helix-turn-helix transcriptional regulator [Armatimonadota bacterium]
MRKGKRKGDSVPLDEVFEKTEKDPRWAAAYAQADLEVRLAMQIARARERAHLNQQQLGDAIGTTQSGVSRIERGEQNLTIGTLQKIARAVDSEVIVEFRPRQAAHSAARR